MKKTFVGLVVGEYLQLLSKSQLFKLSYANTLLALPCRQIRTVSQVIGNFMLAPILSTDFHAGPILVAKNLELSIYKFSKY